MAKKRGKRAKRVATEKKERPKTPPPITQSRREDVEHFYKIEWDKSKTRFNAETEGLRIWGYYRKTRVGEDQQTIAYAIDIYVKAGNGDHCLESIGYSEDPRVKLSSLNKDIAAAISRWIYKHGRGGDTRESIEDLEKRANNPTIRFSRLAELDAVILGLTQLRSDAIRSGGERMYFFKGAQKESPRVQLVATLHSEALAYRGHAPPLTSAPVRDEDSDEEQSDDNDTEERGDEEQTEKASKVTEKRPRIVQEKIQGDLSDIYSKFQSCTDKREKKRLRAAMRSINKDWRKVVEA